MRLCLESGCEMWQIEIEIEDNAKEKAEYRYLFLPLRSGRNSFADCSLSLLISPTKRPHLSGRDRRLIYMCVQVYVGVCMGG